MYRLTTIDNPYNPFDDFQKWYLYDMTQGYNTCAYLARLVQTSDHNTDEENDELIDSAMDDIIKYDFMNIYRKVKPGENVYAA